MIQLMVESDKEKILRGKRIEACIKKTPFSRSEIAEKIGVTTQTLSKWCSGNPIQSENLWALADIVGDDPVYLNTGVKSKYDDLHKLVEQLNEVQYQQVKLFTNTILNARDSGMEFSINFSTQKTP